MTAKFEYFIDSTLVGLNNHEYCIFLEDAVVTLLISLIKIASYYRLSDSEMVELLHLTKKWRYGFNDVENLGYLHSIQ